MKTILFICTGNVCRSPMAEGILRHVLNGRSDIRILSAGVGAGNGQPPSTHSLNALNEWGIDITDQRSQLLTADLVAQADLILGMTQGHVESILMMFPEASGRVHRLRDFDPTLDIFERDICDPIGGSFEIYQACRDQIKSGIEAMLTALESNSSEPTTDTLKLVLGADHGGYELKESIRKHLESKGYDIVDLGTHSAESTDYPDYARPAAEQVSLGQVDFGILVCTTGVGVCIAANKVPGARAALVCDESTAAVVREHNDANLICLSGRTTPVDAAIKIVDTFLESTFVGGRHERRVSKLEGGSQSVYRIQQVDPAIADLITKERNRQQENIELIASENFTSPAVMEAQGSVLTNKYAEGYPKKRWYGGCEFVDEVEQLAIDRAKQIFGAEHANVQPHSGSGANMAVYFAMLKPGDKMLTMDLSHGGHLTHGNKVNFSGKFFEIVHYGVSREDEHIDYDQLEAAAKEHRPRMITVGASAYPRVIDFERMGKIAKEVGALMLADIAHIAGLVAAGIHPSPVGHADFVTTTTHKTLRGPRGGLILCGAEHAKAIDSQTFPGIQGGPLMHVIAAKAVCFHEAMQPGFRSYQEQVVKNAAALAGGMIKNGFRLVSGGTDNHVMMVDVGARDLTGKECQAALDEAGITTNKNTIPFETRSPFQASGVRLGSPAVTTRGMMEPEMAAIADMISEVLLDIKNLDAAHKVRERVRELTARFPLPY